MKYIGKSIVDASTGILYRGIALSSLYYICRALLKGNTNINTNIMGIVLLINVLCLLNYLHNIGYKNEDCIKFLLNIVMAQSIIGVVMLISPNVREIALKLYLTGTIREDLKWLTSYRIYGITGDYTYITPIFHGMIGTIAVIYAVWKDKKYCIYIPFIIFIILVNGRTGIAIMLIGIAVAFSCMLINKIRIVKIIKYIILLSIVVSFSIISLKVISPTTYEWLNDGVQEIVKLFTTGEKEGNFKVLIDDMWFLPQGIGMIFGEGYSVYAGAGKMFGSGSSDIGYINDLFMGGLVYVGILYGSYIKFLLSKTVSRSKTEMSKINRSISLSFIVMLLVANYKGECMRGTNLLLGMIFVKILLLDELELVKKDARALLHI
ncbi:MAG: hypothetical protein AB9856_14995 [Cellulosilyticaceae bacterium]